MRQRNLTLTGDLADAIARADQRQTQMMSELVVFAGIVLFALWQAHALSIARRRERAEWGFMLDAAADAAYRAHTIHVDRDGEASRGEPETPPPTEPPAE
jgi:hypothetical protein